MKKVLAICSGGGHWTEMRRIMPAFADLDVTFASIRPEYSLETAGRPYFSFRDFHRLNMLGVFRSAVQIVRIVAKVKPDVVITTGSAPALIALSVSKLVFRSKTIWIDSIANCEQLSTSGSMARYVSDVWLTQWKHLASEKGPHWVGAVL